MLGATLKSTPFAKLTEKTYIFVSDQLLAWWWRKVTQQEKIDKRLWSVQKRLEDRWKEMDLGHRVEGRGTGLRGVGVGGGDCGVEKEGGEA